jgi:hypothetical protein
LVENFQQVQTIDIYVQWLKHNPTSANNTQRTERSIETRTSEQQWMMVLNQLVSSDLRHGMQNGN